MSSPYLLTCLLCEEANPHPVNTSLVELQEHTMEAHGVTREHLAQVTSQKQETALTLIWTYSLPDGRPWLHAERLLGLVKTGFTLGFKPRGLAEAFDLSFALMAWLDEAAIEAESLPAGLLAHLARVLGISEQLLLAYLSGPRHPTPFPHGKGTNTKLSFKEASVELTPEQRQRWLGVTNR